MISIMEVKWKLHNYQNCPHDGLLLSLSLLMYPWWVQWTLSSILAGHGRQWVPTILYAQCGTMSITVKCAFIHKPSVHISSSNNVISKEQVLTNTGNCQMLSMLLSMSDLSNTLKGEIRGPWTACTWHSIKKIIFRWDGSYTT